MLFGADPAPGVRVHAYPEAGESFTGPGFTYSAPTAADGTFTVNLPSGSYFLVAKGPRPPFPSVEPGTGDFFGLYEHNPVAVGAGSAANVTIRVDRKR